MARRRRPFKPAGLILFHGAGGDRNHRLFLRIEAELGERLGLPVTRIDFPYRQKGPGRRPPDRMPKLVAAIEDAVTSSAEAWSVDPKRIVVGGRSMGGRAASVAMAQGLDVAGLVALSYPLHPPGRPETLRVDHLTQVTKPVLLVQGRRDPFGTPEEFQRHFGPAVGGPVTEIWVEGNHDPKPSLDDEIIDAIEAWLKPSR